MRRLLWLAVLTALLGSCEPSRPAEPAFGNRILKGPRKPGGSITHTKMCECQACDPGDCCQGDWGETGTNGEECKASEDPEHNELTMNCGLSVSSCSARCFNHVWRIDVEASCQATTPLVCCHG